MGIPPAVQWLAAMLWLGLAALAVAVLTRPDRQRPGGAAWALWIAFWLTVLATYWMLSPHLEPLPPLPPLPVGKELF